MKGALLAFSEGVHLAADRGENGEKAGWWLHGAVEVEEESSVVACRYCCFLGLAPNTGRLIARKITQCSPVS